MARRSSRPHSRRKVLPLGVQDLGLQQAFPGFRRTVSSRRTVWTGSLQPTPESPVYTVRISFTLSGIPAVRVLTPKPSARAPHRYRNGDLCLYYPRDRSWTPDQFIWRTLVPWTVTWLFFYELWLDTGKWLGPEAPHDFHKKAG